jgi:hypothetical protein
MSELQNLPSSRRDNTKPIHAICKLLAIGIFCLAGLIGNVRTNTINKDGWLSTSSAQHGLYFGMVFDVSNIAMKNETTRTKTNISTPIVSMLVNGTTIRNTEKPPLDIAVLPNETPPACRVLISNRVGDFHYEVLESIALQYPIDWTRNTNAAGCRKAGLDDDNNNNGLMNPIAVDFLLDFKYKGYSNATEAWGWKEYFEKHLKGTVVQRHARFRTGTYQKRGSIAYDEDQRWIQFHSIIDATPEKAIDWKAYDVSIETNCGFVGNWEERLKRKRETDYCVLHSSHPKKVRELQLLPQICNLNPQHAPRCWFLPSDLPKFPPPDPPSEGRPVRICIGWKADSRGEYRDTSLLAKALERVRPENVKVVVIGRNARIPKHIQAAASNISHYVVLESSHKAFYDYQHAMSQCHVMVPLIHPDGASADYFLGRKGGGSKGKLSGMISQTIGNAIPALVHSAVADIYQDLFTAPIFEYNETGNPTSFIQAFEQIIAFYNATDQHT